MKKPTVSIIIPVFNTEKYIAKSIGSIIEQSYTDWELIIVDDSSTDNTYSICEMFASQNDKIKLYQNTKNLGMMSNWNYALSLISAECKYWGKLDADDYWGPDMLMKCFNVLESNADIGMVCGRFVYIDENGGIIPGTEKIYPDFAQNKSISLIPLVRGGIKTIFRHNLTQQGVGLIRKKFIADYGDYLLIPAGDTEFHFRVGAHYQIHFINKVLHYHRVWNRSFTKSLVTNQFGTSEKNLFEATTAIFNYYLKNDIIARKDYNNLVLEAEFEFNKTLIALSRLKGEMVKTCWLLIKQLFRKPLPTIVFYLKRLSEKASGQP